MSLLAYSQNLIKYFDIRLVILGSLLLGWPSVTNLFLVKSLHYLSQLRSLNQRQKVMGTKKREKHLLNPMVAKASLAYFTASGASKKEEIFL